MKHSFKAALTAVAIAGGLTLASPATAHAGPDANFLNCLNSHGYNVTNSDQALSIARRIQNDESRTMPRAQLIRNLQTNYGLDPRKANVYVDCAWNA